MKQIYLFLVGTFVANFGFTTPIFLNQKDAAWKAELLETMEWVNSELPAEWEKPKNFNIAYVEGRQATYYPLFKYKGQDESIKTIEKLLVLGNDDRVTFLHEYAHLVFDEHMRKVSKPWQYYIAWRKFDFTDLEEKLENLEKSLPNLIKVNKELKEKLASGNTNPVVKSAIENTNKSIAESKENILVLKSAIKIQSSVPYLLDNFDSLTALQSYFEVLADAVGVSIVGEWGAMKEAILSGIQSQKEGEVVLPPIQNKQGALEEYLSYRNFLPGLRIHTYPFKAWEKENPYWHFKPFRSHLRDYSEEVSLDKKELMLHLGNAIIDVYENIMIPNPGYVNVGLRLKNQDLWNSYLHSLYSNQASLQTNN